MKSSMNSGGVLGLALMMVLGLLAAAPASAQGLMTENGADSVDCFSQSQVGGMTGAVLCNNATSYEPIHCYRQATQAMNLPGTLASVLCSGARTDAPLKCYLAAAQVRMAGNLAAFLCTRSHRDTPLVPVKCAMKAAGLPLAVSAVLCSAATSETGPLECFQKARGVAGNVAAVLCSENPEAKYFDPAKIGGR